MKSKMEIRIWEGSPLIGKDINSINDEFNIKIIKVSRGQEATNPKGDLIIEEADYIRYIGDSSDCINVINKSIE